MAYGLMIIEPDRKKVEEWLLKNVADDRIVRKGWIAENICDMMLDTEQYRNRVVAKAKHYFDRVTLHNEGS